LADQDKGNINNVMIPIEERRAAFRRHNRRMGAVSGIDYGDSER
jgi:hypothetical protein